MHIFGRKGAGAQFTDPCSYKVIGINNKKKVNSITTFQKRVEIKKRLRNPAPTQPDYNRASSSFRSSLSFPNFPSSSPPPPSSPSPPDFGCTKTFHTRAPKHAPIRGPTTGTQLQFIPFGSLWNKSFGNFCKQLLKHS